jgi:hypothetical protein
LNVPGKVNPVRCAQPLAGRRQRWTASVEAWLEKEICHNESGNHAEQTTSCHAARLIKVYAAARVAQLCAAKVNKLVADFRPSEKTARRFFVNNTNPFMKMIIFEATVYSLNFMRNSISSVFSQVLT